MASSYYKLDISERTETRSKGSKALRREGLIPGVLYYSGEKNVNITVDKSVLFHAMQSGQRIFEIDQDGESHYAKIISFADDSDIWITQEGSGDHNAYVYNSGSAHNNSTRLIQKGSGNKDADVWWYADDGDLTLTQQGNGSHTSNMKFYTDDYDVTVVQKGWTNKSYTATFNCTSNCDKTITIMQEN